ncbi:IclR family transcriptional regulator [Galactobacter sp.]|uniref:IclR family transcriptional regulator n=1 Tax=Galactobacter sp. TaxID=2676125 RepID=UPI0025BAB90E|nr:IclR family transcriptional regulator [Galactobacter sp.]
MAETHTTSGADVAPVQAVDRALQLLELLADNGPTSVSSLAKELGVHRSTAFRLLATLQQRRFVEHRDDGNYMVGPGAVRVAGAVTSRTTLAREGAQICTEVTAELDETSNVAVLVDGYAVNVAQATGTSAVAVRDQFIGRHTPGHATSSGKVLLAYADPDVAKSAIAGAERFSATTIVDPAALRRALAEVRERGWASAISEWQEDTNAVAVPVFDSDGGVIAALSLTAPSFRLKETDLPAVAERLRIHADELSRRLGHLHARP